MNFGEDKKSGKKNNSLAQNYLSRRAANDMQSTNKYLAPNLWKARDMEFF